MFTDEQLHHPLLTHEEEIALGQRIQAGDCDALDELVLHNLRMVYKIAYQWHTDDPATEFDDLVQVGLMGLLTAARKYDPTRDNRFATYAHWWVRQAISRTAITAGTIRRRADPHYQPVKPASLYAKNVSQARIARLDAQLLHNRSGESSENTLADILADSAPSVEELVFTNIEVERLIASLKLNQRGQAIIRDWLSGVPRVEAQRMHGVSRSWLDAMVFRPNKEKYMSREKEPNICIEPGCKEPKYVNPKGTTMARCHEHQKQFWRESQRAKADAAGQRGLAAAYRPEADQPKVDHTFHEPQPGTIRKLIRPVPATVQDLEQVAEETAPQTEELIEQIQEQTGPQQPPSLDGCTCPDCIYREVISLLAVRNPRISQLVDTLLYARQLRDDLGI